MYIIWVKYCRLDLERDFIELKERELNDRRVKVKRETEELFFKTIMVSIDDMEKIKME